ncbi:MAG: hypothetical protein HC799_10220 [Limnothrix sp. RL_2_0]|nr:hypothetical protein [Limnothrix sp. RL_2_0]
MVQDYRNSINLERVWEAIATDLPKLQDSGQMLLKSLI